MANRSFTFWANMKEAIDVYEGNPEFQYKMYDALTEFALYGVWPEDDGSMESKALISFVQTMVPSVEKSQNYNQKCSDLGASGGRKQKVTDEQIESAIRSVILRLNKEPSRNEIAAEIKTLYMVDINVKTISRRFSKEAIKEIYLQSLGRE